MYRFVVFLLWSLALSVFVIDLWTLPVHAQSRADRRAPAYGGPALRRGGGSAAPNRGRNRPVRAPGTGLPPAAEPAPPPSFGSSFGRGREAGARAKSNLSTPDTPAQAPVGGAEWLAVAGAAYALNRLRKKRSTDEAEEG